ncbi:MAG: YihY/virulence factor BrkB family protein [Paracoccaceae bacterium]|nr:MAG: YihY/virulence factor BrkB family protein [Paracoccaceae bacterium]
MKQFRAFLSAAGRLYAQVTRRDISQVAAGVAFFAFLSVFPGLAAIIALWGFVSDPAVIRSQLELARDFLPPEAFTLMEGQISALLAVNNRDLGWATALSTLIALWSARAGVAALVQGVNAVHGLPPRGGLWDIARALLLTVMLVGLVLAAMVLAIGTPLAIGFLPLGPWQGGVLETANVALGLTLVVAAIAMVYRLAPNHGAAPPLFTRGLLVAVVLWAIASRGLVVYLANFGSYNQVYGSLGAVAALLLWVYLSAYAILLGAAIDAARRSPQ